MEEKRYVLSMDIFECNVLTGQIKESTYKVNDCYLYKQSNNINDIWLASDEINPNIDPGMITDDRKKIYFLKNWIFNDIIASCSKGILTITVFDNTYIPNNKQIVYNKIKDYIDKCIKNLTDFKEKF